MSDSKRIAVIGGGVIGVACAHYLQQAGHTVTVLDRGTIGGACSHGNCGYVSPSHVLPLAEPGAIQRTLRALLVPNSPFRIRPRLDLNLWSWLWRFAGRCNRPDMLRAGRGIQAMLESAMTLYVQLMDREALACEWEKRGMLFVYRSQRAMAAFDATNRLLADKFHEPAQRLSGREVESLEPALLPNLAGGWYYEHDAHLRPDRLMQSWRQLLTQRGVTIIEKCDFHGFTPMLGRTTAAAANTASGPVEADAFVVATGAWTPQFARELGARIPIQPGKGYSMTMSRPATCPRYPMLFPEHRVGVTPWASGMRLGSIMEFAGYDTSLRPERLALLTNGASHYLRSPLGETVTEEWYGWRPMTYDSLPIIDRAPAWNNVWIAAGHNMLGLSMAPATGRLVAELLDGRPPHISPEPYSVKRFG